ncbi:hypothetical protein H9Q74_011247 [Fusarium xylarioides]|nr:hypothetical protein H9Q71_012478 [Fusarium xylarioides]KAG5816206.1 hypothetical protein H9Q74_011247 [Fusarium xylarioides]
MSLDHRIQLWLQQIQTGSTSTPQTRQGPKRRRLNPPTPVASQSDNSMASPKKHNLADHDDEFETPRPSRRIRTPRSESGTSLPSTQSASQASGRSSPTKQLRALALNSRGVVTRELSAFPNMPESLDVLLEKIDLASSGIGILPSSQRSIYGDFKWARQPILSNILFSDDRDKLGHTPTPEAVQWILHEAAYCNSRGCSEADWNMEVHHRVLSAALRPLQGPRSDQFFDFRLSTTASIIAEYHVTSASKKVDFCMYLDPKQDESAQVPETIDALKNILPLGMFNHTNLAPLCDNPIAVSIETKKTGEGWENAKLQMEVWMAAHWQFLRQLLSLRQRSQEPTTTNEKTWNLPDFIPGIIIQGHHWHLIITTPEGEKTVFWQVKNLGDTSSSQGIYKIIHNLQLLRQWAQEEYWKWMRELLLEWPRIEGELVIA